MANIQTIGTLNDRFSAFMQGSAAKKAIQRGGPPEAAQEAIRHGVITQAELTQLPSVFTAGLGEYPNFSPSHLTGQSLHDAAIFGTAMVGGLGAAGALGSAGTVAGTASGTAAGGTAGTAGAGGGLAGLSPLASALISGGAGAANADLTQERTALDAYGLNTNAQDAYQKQIADQRRSALRDLALQSYVENPRSSPFNPRGNPTYNPNFVSTLDTLGQQGSTLLSTPAPAPTYTPLSANAGTLQHQTGTTPSTLSTLATLGGLGWSVFGPKKPNTPSAAPPAPAPFAGRPMPTFDQSLMSGDSMNYYD